jgi:hypothetical protein
LIGVIGKFGPGDPYGRPKILAFERNLIRAARRRGGKNGPACIDDAIA